MDDKYLLFVWIEHESNGGFGDFVYSASTLDECQEESKRQKLKYPGLEVYQIVRVSDLEVVEEGLYG